MRAVAILVVVLVVLGLGAWVAIAQVFDKGSANNPGEKSVNVVLNDLDTVRGKRVAVAGDVKTSLAPWAVLLGSSDATQLGLLVVARDRLPGGVATAARVSAVGTARPFSLAAFRRSHPQLTARQLERSPLRELDGKPAVVDAKVALQTPTG
ncbi:MAG TPA: hypothetical protein VGC78_04360 [Gaiellaceae bacterium]|jgi:hypothetical protein